MGPWGRLGIVAILTAGAAAADGPAAGPAGGGFAVLPHALLERGSELAGTALATAIREGGAEAARAGLRPMPPDLRARMAARYPDAVLREVRWGIAAEASSVGRVVFGLGDAVAVTLGRTVVFRDARGAEDATLWAHELAHVMQYERWGIDGFAQRYARDARGVEAEAERAARDWAAGAALRPVPRPPRAAAR